MKAEEIAAEWAKDCKIKQGQIETELMSVSELHLKYFRYYMQAKKEFRALQFTLKSLEDVKADYYGGKMSKEELQERGWPQFLQKVLKGDLPRKIDGDNDIKKLKLQLGEEADKVQFLEDIIKHINNRGYNLKTLVDYLKWTQGAA